MLNSVITIAAFLLSLIVILVASRKSLTIGIFFGAMTLGLLTLTPEIFLENTIKSLTNIETLLLAIAVGLIPVLGGLLNESGLLDSMIKNYKFSRKSLILFSPAMLGLLPMPGGALFSAPLVDKAGGEKISKIRKGSINVWFRHILHLIYPLAPTLIIASQLAGLITYEVILYLFPFFILTWLVGQYLLLCSSTELDSTENETKWKDFLVPIFIIAIAPVIDFLLRTFIGLKSLATLIGVSASLILAIIVSKPSIKSFFEISKKSKPWDFFFLILFIYLYQGFFKVSGVSELIEILEIPTWVFLIVISFTLGFLTGRTSTPLVILIPIFIAKFGSMSALDLALMYYTTLLGYILSPIHPCVVFTADYYEIDVKYLIKDSLTVTAISMIFGLLLYFLLYICVCVCFMFVYWGGGGSGFRGRAR